MEREHVLDALGRMLANGPLTHLPGRESDLAVLLALATWQLVPRRVYRESEVNEVLRKWIESFCSPGGVDHVTLRRCLVDARFLARDPAGSTYSVVLATAEQAIAAEARDVRPGDVLEVIRHERKNRKRVHAGCSITVHDDIPREDAAVIDAGLGHSNEAAAPLHEVRPLCSFARDEAGKVIGGAVGRTWGSCCELQQLWVDPGHRRLGIGARLVGEFERRAEARGCRTFYLETFSFQAPKFYRSLGYETKSQLHGFGPGIVKYLMVREAAADAAEASGT